MLFDFPYGVLINQLKPRSSTGLIVDAEEIIQQLQIPFGVFYPDWGSVTLAKIASKYNGNFLDMGTGSGFIAIYLAKLGKEVEASDISSKALAAANKNFAHFGLSSRLLYSSLYSNIPSKYDVVCYNPPKVSRESEFKQFLKSALSRSLPSSALNLLKQTFIEIDTKSRRAELIYLIEQSKSHLVERGVLLLNLISEDSTWLASYYPVSEKASNGKRTVVEISL